MNYAEDWESKITYRKTLWENVHCTLTPNFDNYGSNVQGNLLYETHCTKYQQQTLYLRKIYASQLQAAEWQEDGALW